MLVGIVSGIFAELTIEKELRLGELFKLVCLGCVFGFIMIPIVIWAIIDEYKDVIWFFFNKLNDITIISFKK